jgi:cytochrome b
MGAVMVLVLLAMVGFQAVTGLFTSDDIVFAGPYNGAVSSSTANWMGSWHHRNFDVLQWLILLHIVAVLYYVFFKKQNLIGAMLSGRKPAHVVSETEAISGSQVLKAVVLALVITGAIWWLVSSAPPPADFEY